MVDGRYECALCGEMLAVSTDATPRIIVRAAGGARNMRSIQVDGREVHACPTSGDDGHGSTRLVHDSDESVQG